MDTIAFHGDYDFSMPNIEDMFQFYDIYEGSVNFKAKTGKLFPKYLIKQVEGRRFANCIKFNEHLNEDPCVGTQLQDNINKTIKYPSFYGKGEILLELHKLLEVHTEKQPEDLRIHRHTRYYVKCEMYQGTIIVKDILDYAYYIFQQNNGDYLIISDQHISILNNKEKLFLGI